MGRRHLRGPGVCLLCLAKFTARAWLLGPSQEMALVRLLGSTPWARLKHLPLAPQPKSPPISRHLLTFVEVPWMGHGEDLLKGS